MIDVTPKDCLHTLEASADRLNITVPKDLAEQFATIDRAVERAGRHLRRDDSAVTLARMLMDDDTAADTPEAHALMRRARPSTTRRIRADLQPSNSTLPRSSHS